MAAGDKLRALDRPPVAWLDEQTDSDFTNTTYSATSGTPTLPVCGVSFTAPTSGRVKITWRARFECQVNNSRCVVSVQVATGGTLNSGSVVSAYDDESAIETVQSPAATTTPAETRMHASQFRMLSGLTPGNTYNAVTGHKAFNATGGNMYSRGILVEPVS